MSFVSNNFSPSKSANIISYLQYCDAFTAGKATYRSARLIRHDAIESGYDHVVHACH